MAKKKKTNSKTVGKKRGRKKNQQLILCSKTLNEYKKEDCVLITSNEEPTHNIYVSKVWWEANKNKTKKYSLHTEIKDNLKK